MFYHESSSLLETATGYKSKFNINQSMQYGLGKPQKSVAVK
jgi:hypothetical protein